MLRRTARSRRPPGPARIRRRHSVTLAVCSVLLLGGCGKDDSQAVGGEEQARQTEAQTEAIYVPIGGLKYQVQISRILSPYTAEDEAYLEGVAGGPESVPPGQVWFGVFIRVENDSGESHRSTADLSLTDSEGKRYRPVALPSDSNPFAYAPTELGPGGLLPEPDTPPGQGTIKGLLVLFQITVQSLQNRPLTLRLGEDVGNPGSIELDV
jgi:hypothetical protein